MSKVNSFIPSTTFKNLDQEQIVNKPAISNKTSKENLNNTKQDHSAGELYAQRNSTNFNDLQRFNLHNNFSNEDFGRSLKSITTDEPPIIDPDLIDLSDSSRDDDQPYDSKNPGRVARLQELLIEGGTLTHQNVGNNWGVFGNNTDRAVRDFQRNWGLDETGIVDETTLRYLENPPDRAELGLQMRMEMREQVRQDAIDSFASQHQLAPDSLIEAIGDRAAKEFDRQIEHLVSEEMNQHQKSNPDTRLNNMTPEDRAALEATADYSAVQRYEWSYNAVKISAEQMNGGKQDLQNYNNNNSTTATSEAAWNDWCQAFTSAVYNFDIPEMRNGSAAAAITAFKESGQLRNDLPLNELGFPDFSDVPPGTVVYFDRDPDGHVALFTGKFTADGEPIIRTTGWNSETEGKGRNGISELPFSALISEFGLKYVGYVSYPDPNPNGF